MMIHLLLLVVMLTDCDDSPPVNLLSSVIVGFHKCSSVLAGEIRDLLQPHKSLCPSWRNSFNGQDDSSSPEEGQSSVCVVFQGRKLQKSWEMRDDDNDEMRVSLQTQWSRHGWMEWYDVQWRMNFVTSYESFRVTTKISKTILLGDDNCWICKWLLVSFRDRRRTKIV